MKFSWIATLAGVLGLAGLSPAYGQWIDSYYSYPYYTTYPATGYSSAYYVPAAVTNWYYPVYGTYYTADPYTVRYYDYTPKATLLTTYPTSEGYVPGYPTTTWYYDYYAPLPTTTSRQVGVPVAQATASQRVDGEVLWIKRVPVEGSRREVLAALVKTAARGWVIVDLGLLSRLQAEDFRLHRGDQIAAHGWFTRLGPLPLLVADRVTDNNKVVYLGRRQPASRLLKRVSHAFDRTAAVEPLQQKPFQPRDVQGTIERMKTITPPGSREKWVVAMVKGPTGPSYLVNLGPRDKLAGLHLAEGKLVLARGPACSIDGRTVILAERVEAKGRTVRISPAERVRPEAVQVHGRVQAVKAVQLPGMKHRLLMAQMVSDQGREFFVNFGPAPDAKKLDLGRGDQMTVKGQEVNLHGERFLLANQASANGRTVSLNGGTSR